MLFLIVLCYKNAEAITEQEKFAKIPKNRFFSDLAERRSLNKSLYFRILLPQEREEKKTQRAQRKK